ncbi:chitin synthase regulator 3, variant 1 [Neurospora crassa OR74A]|uniref:Chitin synthase regulator 3 n=1 Tax=Neurospora crassa (strain ATCC 24698 / 74-OR23-1A / CBS 708.71 / DSM 1257 / FGSC 987) TaxID=367110 RepID=V5IML5_NEUCR|nr:chitin synthase regulator 3, variant 2 [Neurospora crassa OR74A]XP_011395145.1 chitin synthase regulator 3 [Neurospora crassa OR74A]XP_011395146.1 chitin synthase regulator 3, variant 1 [Neurospora crassa OR74A]ESA41984.1 chitin synthase regulator 3 [Neurospora crassa OR74A]ESA41985.1 chitin synthase regulator 3, variant 1 [Neurospora crassa OR74A]ESA41986.1 chitin synthase regulator 3, variant 2 [Neurospora crassa OR74A]|eukprot:XP_011395144.1 chitin synthase regulator 3, variant 2 [Neurospora crassa OR74A]
MPTLGATFVPGGYDDYFMPEVVAPAPQRVMPEVPQNMQKDIQRMELEAREVDPQKNNGTIGSAKNRDQQQDEKTFKPFQQRSGARSTAMDAPSFSPFPKVKGENIPPSDEEKEEILYQARTLVLHSNNVSMQVTWARDSLIWVDIAQEAAARDWKRDGKGRERPSTPTTEHELRVDALNIIEYLASQDHPEANFMKGKWLEFGKFGYRENKREAYAHYKRAAENGYGRAEYRMGMLYENSNDIPNAIKHYEAGVRMKDTASNYRLGMIHLMGQHGFHKDILQGLDMIQLAADTADEDSPQGAYVYGLLLSRELPDITIPEDILPFDLVVARQYIEKAAYLGFPKAQLKMGQAYELSQLGCDFNPTYSLHYYGLAARQGQSEAALGVSRWFLFGFEGAFSKNEALAYKYALDAANAGLATGEFAMGYYHEIGIHVQKNVIEARKWYEKAADHGNKDAMTRLDSLSQSKTLTKQDHETTTLTRIKSQHGSQRGKRPERFSRPTEVLPTLSEGDPGDNVPPVPVKASQGSAIGHDQIDFPDPARNANRPPAFTVNFDSNPNLNLNLTLRSKSTAPYPEDTRPPPLRARTNTAPYPEDDMRHPSPPPHMQQNYLSAKPLAPHFNPGIRPSSSSGGPHADRPMSAFGIRPNSANGPSAPQGPGPRGRVPPGAVGTWEPQVSPGYRQPSPGPGPGPGSGPRPDYRQNSYRPPHDVGPGPSPQRMSGGAGPGIPPSAAPIGDPMRQRLQKPNPNAGNYPPAQQVGGAMHSPQQSPGLPPVMSGGAQPGYGSRTNSNRPNSDAYGHGQGAPPMPGRFPTGTPTPGNGGPMPRPDRLDSLATGGRPGSNGGQGPSGAGIGRIASAPPVQQHQPPHPHSKPTHSPGPSASPTPSAASTTRLPGHGGAGGKSNNEHPDGKTVGNGPATFEEMGIPQGKNDSDCVVM